MPRYGNTSVSALLSQARAALKKQQAYEEEIASYEYDLSPKDQESYDKYASFLTKRAKEVQSSDPAKALSLTRKITGANRSFTSSEIQRQSISVLEGTGSKQQKLQVMIGLYRRALENGDEATAQRLQLQADTLQQSILADEQAKAGSGGGTSKAETAAKRGISDTVERINMAEKELKRELSTGKITSKDYISQVAQLYDAKEKTLRNAYTVKDGYVLPNGNGISNDAAEEFYKSHQSVLENESFQKLLGNNRNVPLETRLAQIGGAFKTKLDPLTGEVKFEPNNIVGLRRLTEFGSNLAAPDVADNVDGSKYSKAFKSLGLSGGDKGSINKTYTDFAGNTREGQFFVDNPDNPKYAYTQDEKNVRYALQPDGTAVMLGDSYAASKQFEALQQRLEDPNISPQEREAIQKDIQNLNTDLVPQSVIDANKKGGEGNLSTAEGFVNEGGKIVKKLYDQGSRDIGSVGNFFNKVAQNKLTKSVLDRGGNFGGYAANLLSPLTSLFLKADQVKQLDAKKAAADAAEAQRRAELEARSRAALAAIAPAAKPNYAQNTLRNVSGPYRIPEATQKAADTVGTPQFTQKYAFPGIDLSKYLR